MKSDIGGLLITLAAFAVIVLVVSLPFALIIWGVRQWYATHRLAMLPWRRRRVLLGLALLWNATFSRLPKWLMIVGIAATLSLLYFAFLIVLAQSVYADTPEACTIQELKIARRSWLYDGCEHPPDSEKYLGENHDISGTNYTYTNAHLINGRTYHGLFALKRSSNTNTYVVTTTDEILVLEDSGRVRLLKKAGKW